MSSARIEAIMETRLLQPVQTTPTGPRPASETRANKRATGATQRGFSMVEVMLVAAIAVILAAIAVPKMTTSLTLTKWRGQINDLSGVFQSCRSLAIKNNNTQQLNIATSDGRVVAYIDVPGALESTPEGKTQVWMFSGFSHAATPLDTDTNPVPLTAGLMWGGSSTLPPVSGPEVKVCFNSRGIPCTCPSTPNAYCTSITNGYAFYFTQDGQWAALGISPAGRIKTYFWDGGAWAN
jgi:prepilin-type N-terminal cleavage/methylation domain-containing protein